MITVNGKLMYIDGEDNWVATVELTRKEIEAANKYIQNISHV